MRTRSATIAKAAETAADYLCQNTGGPWSALNLVETQIKGHGISGARYELASALASELRRRTLQLC